MGRILGFVDARWLVALGFALLAFSTWQFGNLDLVIAPSNVTWPNISSGFATALIFVPMTALAMGTLKNEQMGNATGIFNLMRNLGGSIGIAMVTALLSRGAQTHQAVLASHLSATDPIFVQRQATVANLLTPALGPGSAAQASNGILYGQLLQQSNLGAYIDNFRLLAIMCLACLPFVLLFKKAKPKGKPALAGH